MVLGRFRNSRAWGWVLSGTLLFATTWVTLCALHDGEAHPAHEAAPQHAAHAHHNVHAAPDHGHATAAPADKPRHASHSDHCLDCCAYVMLASDVQVRALVPESTVVPDAMPAPHEHLASPDRAGTLPLRSPPPQRVLYTAAASTQALLATFLT